MKDSGIDWIGKIPDDWKVKRLKFVSKNRNEKYDKKYGILDYFSLENIESQSGRYVETKNEYDISQSLICKKEDVVFGKLRPYLAKVYKVEKLSCCSSEFAVFYNFEGNSSFLKYYFLSDGFVKIVDSSTYGTKMPRANIDFIRNMKVPLPPLSEQTKIANFLDKKCTQIDSIIEESKKSIEEYKSWKQSVIFEAVTGKNLSCKKKDSGIEWLGEIPEEWEVQRLKSYFNFKKGLPITKENLEDSGISVISYGQIHSKNNNGVSICNELIRFVDKSYLKSNSESLVKKGDFIFADTSEDLEGCGNCAYVNSDEIIFAGYHTIIFSSKYQNENKYLAYLFLTDAWRTQIRCNCSGVKLFSITKKILSKVSIILPPLSEQKSIAKFLDTKCAQIDSLISEKQSLIKDLAEYKKSLIFEAVTGKRRV